MYQTLNKLFVKTAGTGESLLVLHGWGMNSSVWGPVRAQLESHYRVTWVDLPGHGINRSIPAVSMDELVEFVCDVMPNQTHLMGWSLGGLVAQAIGQKVPDKIQSMTLVASTLRFSQTDNWQNAMSLDVLNNFAKSLREDIEVTLKRFIALQFMGVKDSKEIQRDLIQTIIDPQKSLMQKSLKTGGGVFLGDKITPTIEALNLGLKILIESDFRDDVVKFPQQWLFAERDRLIPSEVINDLKSLRPNAQITLLKNAGHAPFMTHPEEFIDHVTRFIDGQ